MIASLSGRLRRRLEDRIVLETGGVGYEVFLPPIVMRQIEHLAPDDGDKASELSLVTHYHATRDQPRPVLIGFTNELDKEVFEKLITVKDMGPMVAARAPAGRGGGWGKGRGRARGRMRSTCARSPASGRRRPRTSWPSSTARSPSSRSCRATWRLRRRPRRPAPKARTACASSYGMSSSSSSAIDRARRHSSSPTP